MMGNQIFGMLYASPSEYMGEDSDSGFEDQSLLGVWEQTGNNFEKKR
jgi:hypothetical protein